MKSHLLKSEVRNEYLSYPYNPYSRRDAYKKYMFKLDSP